MKNPSEWEGIETIFSRLSSSPTFADVYEVRNKLLHGFEEFTPEFFHKIDDYIGPTRNVALQSISDVLGLRDSTSQYLISLSPLRLLREITTQTNGILNGLPKDTSELLRYPPSMEVQLKSLGYKLKEDGEIDFDINLSHTFRSPTKIVFNANAGGLTGHAEAGIKRVHSSDFK